jgi:hypothetical protein
LIIYGKFRFTPLNPQAIRTKKWMQLNANPDQQKNIIYLNILPEKAQISF